MARTEKKTTLNLRITASRKEKLRRVAEANNRSMNGQIDQMIDELKEPKAKEAGR
jgi:hypothetical protein